MLRRVPQHGDPAGGVTSLVAGAALVASIVDAAAAAKTVPMPHARRRFILLVMVIVLRILGRRVFVARGRRFISVFTCVSCRWCLFALRRCSWF